MVNNLLELNSNTTFIPVAVAETDNFSTFEDMFEKYNVKEYSSKVQLEDIIYEHCIRKENLNKSSELEAFYLINLAQVIKSYNTFVELLPRVRPYYAVKCNSDPALLRLLSELGAGFDCSSLKELDMVEEYDLDYSKDVVFSNPCKQIHHIESAQKLGVGLTTIDSVSELQKISKYWKESKVVVRIAINDSNNSSKFGASYEECNKIFELAKELKVNIIGVSFHVGAQCYSVESFLNGIKIARKIFDMAKKHDFNLSLLDIGDGFPSIKSTKPSFADMATEISALLNELFSEEIKVIAKPGKIFCGDSHTLVCNIFGKREVYSKKQLELNEIKQEYLYYANDGIYNSFSTLFFDNTEINIKPFSTRKTFENCETYKSKIFGPTCDALDFISYSSLPKLEIGDWFYVTEFGSNTRANSTNFNGFVVEKSIYYYLE